jgi:hypothetical protein
VEDQYLLLEPKFKLVYDKFKDHRGWIDETAFNNLTRILKKVL